ncbi:acyl-CoA N-acyltransferase [Astrocystis sublimbata]|nr:acyl-CoA N-acyltransferase [Astrocystis sublimbata]
MPTPTPEKDAVLVEVIDSAEDVCEGYQCLKEAFGTQTNDAIWTAFNPGWETPEGQAAGAERMVQRWRSVARDYRGNANEVFLKATLSDPEEPGRRRVVGLAIWSQATAVAGYGDLIAAEDAKIDLDALYPGNETEQRFLRQMIGSMTRKRREHVRARASADPPAVMVLELCGTHPAFQRRGVAGKLVQWGLDEARRRGVPEAVTEASSMGRGAYQKLGFVPQGSDIIYEVDEEFAGRDKPPNLFMLYTSRP